MVLIYEELFLFFVQTFSFTMHHNQLDVRDFLIFPIYRIFFLHSIFGVQLYTIHTDRFTKIECRPT